MAKKTASKQPQTPSTDLKEADGKAPVKTTRKSAPSKKTPPVDQDAQKAALADKKKVATTSVKTTKKATAKKSTSDPATEVKEALPTHSKKKASAPKKKAKAPAKAIGSSDATEKTPAVKKTAKKTTAKKSASAPAKEVKEEKGTAPADAEKELASPKKKAKTTAKAPAKAADTAEVTDKATAVKKVAKKAAPKKKADLEAPGDPSGSQPTDKEAPVAKPKSIKTKVAAAKKKDEPAKPASKKSISKKPSTVNNPPKKKNSPKRRPLLAHLPLPSQSTPAPRTQTAPKKLSTAFLEAQRQRLLELRDSLIDRVNQVTRESLGRTDDGNASSAFGQHQADAGSDAYDRDFALNILSKNKDTFYEIDAAIKRIDQGQYGICQYSGEMIPQARLEAIPFARYTVEHQERIDHELASGMSRNPVTSLFGAEEKDLAKAPDEEDD